MQPIMLPVKILSILLAASAGALPATNTDANHQSDLVIRDEMELAERDIEDVVFFKRGDVLTPRDLELADLHGVDIQQMWKHSIVKRADDDDYTIWVHNSYAEPDVVVNATESSSIERRNQSAKTIAHYSRGQSGRHCDGTTYRDDTGPNAPFTGGIQYMATWAQGLGYFYARNADADSSGWVALLVAGSNSGKETNAVLRIKPPANNSGQYVMNADVRRLASETNNRYARKFSGSWRARGWGSMWCTGNAGDVGKGNLATTWSITNTRSRS